MRRPATERQRAYLRCHGYDPQWIQHVSRAEAYRIIHRMEEGDDDNTPVAQELTSYLDELLTRLRGRLDC